MFFSAFSTLMAINARWKPRTWWSRPLSLKVSIFLVKPLIFLRHSYLWHMIFLTRLSILQFKLTDVARCRNRQLVLRPRTGSCEFFSLPAFRLLFSISQSHQYPEDYYCYINFQRCTADSFFGASEVSCERNWGGFPHHMLRSLDPSKLACAVSNATC